MFLASYFVLSTCLKFILHLDCQLSRVLSFFSLPGNSGVARVIKFHFQICLRVASVGFR